MLQILPIALTQVNSERETIKQNLGKVMSSSAIKVMSLKMQKMSVRK